MSWKPFRFLERLAHYTAVASGKKPVKKGSKFSKKAQQAYARGQRDAMNEVRRTTAYKHATPDQRAAYKQKRKESYAAWKASQGMTVDSDGVIKE